MNKYHDGQLYICRHGSIMTSKTYTTVEIRRQFNTVQLDAYLSSQSISRSGKDYQMKMAYFLVQSFAVDRNLALSVFNNAPISGSKGSSGDGLFNLS
jgi:hypothetical protein